VLTKGDLPTNSLRSALKLYRHTYIQSGPKKVIPQF